MIRVPSSDSCVLPGASAAPWIRSPVFWCVLGCCLLSLALLLFAPDVLALSKQIGNIQNRVAELLGWIRNFLFVCAGGAFLAVFATWFTGRPNIKWLITLIVALVLLALVSVIISYFVDTSKGRAEGVDTNKQLQDALSPD